MIWDRITGDRGRLYSVSLRKGFSRRKKRNLFGKGKYFICAGEEKGGKYLEKEKILLGRRRNTEKVKEGNIWRRKKLFCGGEDERRRKRRLI